MFVTLALAVMTLRCVQINSLMLRVMYDVRTRRTVSISKIQGSVEAAEKVIDLELERHVGPYLEATT